MVATFHDIKPWLQEQLEPYAERLDRRNFTANDLTYAMLIVSAVGGELVWMSGGHWIFMLLVPVFVVVRIALSVLDGMMARRSEKHTAEGAFLNDLADVASDALLYLPFATITGLSGYIVGLAVAAGIMVEMASVLAQARHGVRRNDGPFGKYDRALFWSVLAVLIAIGWGGLWINLLLLAAIGLSIWTCYNRCRAEPADRG